MTGVEPEPEPPEPSDSPGKKKLKFDDYIRYLKAVSVLLILGILLTGTVL